MADRRQLTLDLLMRDKTGPASKSGAGNLKTVGEAAEGAAKSTEKLGKESDRAEDQVQRFGRSAKTAAGHMDDLDGEIENVERELVRLAIAWKEAEGAADKADLSKAIRRTQRDLRELNKNKGLIGSLIPDAGKMAAAVTDVGMSAGKSFSKSFSEAIASASGPASIGVAIAGAIMAGAALPIVGSTIAAGILGGAGVGGVIGGLKLAARDSRVKAAAKSLGDEVMDTLDESAGAFVPAALSGIEKIRGSFKEISGDLKSIFDSSARYVDPLVRGVTGMVKQAIGGISKAVASAGPVIDVISRNLPVLGKTIGDVFEKLADRAPEAATALDQVFKVIEGAVVTVGAVLDKLLLVYGALAAGGALGKDARDNWIKYQVEARKAKDETEGLTDAQKALGPEVLSAAEAAGEAGQKMRTYADSMSDAATKGQGLYSSQTNVAQAIADAKKAADENGKTLDINTQKGRDNRTAVENLASALTSSYEAYVKVNGEGRGAQIVAQNNRAAFIKLATQLGASKREAEALATELGLIPAKKTTDFYANTHDAEGRINALNAKANNAARGRTVSFHVSVTGTERLNALGNRIGGYRAEGGPVTAGTPYIVGEKRPEVFVPETNGTIIPSLNHPALASGGAARGGGGTTVMQIPRGAILSADRLVEEISKVVRVRGGNVQLVLGGRNA